MATFLSLRQIQGFNASCQNACLHSDVSLDVRLQLLHSGGRGGSVCGCAVGSRLPCYDVRLQPLRLRLQSLRNKIVIWLSSSAIWLATLPWPAVPSAGTCRPEHLCEVASNPTAGPRSARLSALTVPTPTHDLTVIVLLMAICHQHLTNVSPCGSSAALLYGIACSLS